MDLEQAKQRIEELESSQAEKLSIRDQEIGAMQERLRCARIATDWTGKVKERGDLVKEILHPEFVAAPEKPVK